MIASQQQRLFRFRVSTLCLLWGICCFGFSLTATAAETKPLTGEQIYRKMCVECHAANGQGVTDKANPFHGMKTLLELTTLIDETMPEEDPELCQGEDARRAARYVFDRFYAKDTESASNRSRVQLSHLTVRQYLFTTSDLLANFLGNANLTSKERGLSGEYYDSRSMRGDKRVLKRIDPVINFQFGDKIPVEKITNAEEFSMKWEGSVLAEETGDYEFILKTENGARLWVNKADPIIDEWVSSQGRAKEHKATIRLLGGKPYTLRLHVFKY
ncbi:MAG: c-type cytochrome, partial [Planctomycetaceae bacterium]|nr:c-type cytochrome [Planctomycetaceae bacterium]